jgi:hypothetical protein
MLRLIPTALSSLALVLLTQSASADEAIAYRLSNWHEMHFEDPVKAQQHLAAVEKLGCEVRQNAHDGHIDVGYRAARWQALEVASDELAHQWEDWLKGSGFETLHGHAADHAGHDHPVGEHAGHDHVGHSHAGHDHAAGVVEEVTYRMPDWQTSQAASAQQMPQLVALLKGLGCEVRNGDQTGAEAIQFRCLQWKHIELPSHQIASGWEDWLRRSGFEVHHTH